MVVVDSGYKPPMKWLAALLVLLLACGPGQRVTGADGPSGSGDGPGGDGPGGTGRAFKVYVHSDHVLYTVDLAAKQLVAVGPFMAPKVNSAEDVITDLAVAPDNTIYVISETALYTASASDGHVTRVGSLAACGMRGVALTTTPDGKLWTGDFKGAVCEIDIAVNPPVVKAPTTLQGGFALSGDLVAIDDGTVFGSVYKLADAAGMATQANNVLAKISLTTGAVVQVGSTGYPKLFGIAFAGGSVLGFTHDGTGHVVTIDRMTGVGTMFATFMDPVSHQPLSFAGAGVSSLVGVIE